MCCNVIFFIYNYISYGSSSNVCTYEGQSVQLLETNIQITRTYLITLVKHCTETTTHFTDTLIVYRIVARNEKYDFVFQWISLVTQLGKVRIVNLSAPSHGLNSRTDLVP